MDADTPGMVQFLLEHGADPFLYNSKGFPATMLWQGVDIKKTHNRQQMFKTLLAFNSDACSLPGIFSFEKNLTSNDYRDIIDDIFPFEKNSPQHLIAVIKSMIASLEFTFVHSAIDIKEMNHSLTLSDMILHYRHLYPTENVKIIDDTVNTIYSLKHIPDELNKEILKLAGVLLSLSGYTKAYHVHPLLDISEKLFSFIGKNIYSCSPSQFPEPDVIKCANNDLAKNLYDAGLLYSLINTEKANSPITWIHEKYDEFFSSFVSFSGLSTGIEFSFLPFISLLKDPENIKTHDPWELVFSNISLGIDSDIRHLNLPVLVPSAEKDIFPHPGIDLAKELIANNIFPKNNTYDYWKPRLLNNLPNNHVNVLNHQDVSWIESIVLNNNLSFPAPIKTNNRRI